PGLAMPILSIIADLRFQDVLDILFLCVVAYHLFLWFRGTKALKALVGLLVLGITFTVARTWGLFLTTWVFQILWQVLVLLLIILFQSEIRQALERVNPLQALGLRRQGQPGKWVQTLSEVAFQMAKRRIGALLIVQRADRVDEWITVGQTLEANLSPELVLSIFQKQSPLHDGAMILKEGRITHVASYLPLSSNEALPQHWGTRHRAAAGLSERCDALVVVVSEERGAVTLLRNGTGGEMKTPEELSRGMAEAIRPAASPRVTHWDRVRELAKDQAMVIYARHLKEEKDSNIEHEAIAAIEEMIAGKDVFINKDFIDQMVAPKAAPQRPVEQAAASAAGQRRMTPKYSVQVTNELFHNGNVEAWKRIIESYKVTHPDIEVRIFYENELINDINTLFKWGKVKTGGLIFFQASGENIRNVSKLQKYLFEGASPRFEQFLKLGVGKVLKLF
ncbi:MAG: diadenylate cyclase, partial [Spirochaetes bacterium]|nr:diadenylate cyclase [Spirochaetota bacterium]